MNKPYLVVCKKCKKEFNCSNRKQKFHLACEPVKKKLIYPKEFQHAKMDVQVRDGLICQECGKDLRNESQHPPTHHIDGNTLNNELDNLVMLCRSCHIKKHK